MNEHQTDYQREKSRTKAKTEIYRPTQYFLIGLAVMAFGITVVAIDRLI